MVDSTVAPRRVNGVVTDLPMRPAVGSIITLASNGSRQRLSGFTTKGVSFELVDRGGGSRIVVVSPSGESWIYDAGSFVGHLDAAGSVSTRDFFVLPGTNETEGVPGSGSPTLGVASAFLADEFVVQRTVTVRRVS